MSLLRRGRPLLLALLAAPAGATAQVIGPADTTVSKLPIGAGRLNQDVLTLRLGTGSLDIRFLPLEEDLLRLLAKDGYDALQALIAEQRQGIDSVARRRGVTRPGIALVTFYGLAPNTRFDPLQLTVALRGQPIRPIGALPLSAAFSSQQLGPRDAASGLVLFDRALPVREAFSIRYLSVETEDWERRLPRLNQERSRILGRSSTDPTRPDR